VPEGVLGSPPARLSATAFSEELRAQQREIGVPMLVGEEALEGLKIQEDAQGRVTFSQDKRYNSAYLIDRGAPSFSRYDKVHLTPFGEVMPVVSRWDWLEDQLLALAAGGMRFDLDEGTRLTVFEIPAPQRSEGTVRVVTPICFESTDPVLCRRLVFDGEMRRADIIANLTNDGWFGESDLARRQHLRAARWRAFELMTPVVRSANTGTSAIIDRSGRVVASLPARTDGVLRAEIDLPTRGAYTVHVRFGEWAGWACLVGTIGLVVAAALTNRERQRAA
jgi:apolipoprotein N-acyltransferase